MGGLINRTADNWRPLFAMPTSSDGLAGAHPKAAAARPARQRSTGPMLLADIGAIFESAARLASVDICDD
jgi:hypothetical protein